jgi:hypothetical protein
MIKKLVLISLCVLAVLSAKAADWGGSVQGIRLSITTTNNVLKIATSTSIESVIKNSSTNAITVDVLAPTIYFDVLLTSDTGKLYHITTPLEIRGPGRLVAINPGEELNESIPVTFGNNIEPGDYTLKATRTFTLNDKEFTLESNSIKVKIIK